MSYEAEFGIVLRKLRIEKNYSQVELAKASQVDRTFISLIERGIRQPSFTTIVHFAEALKMRPSELVAAVEDQMRRNRWSRLKR